MKDYITFDEWNIIEQEWHPGYNKISESIFSIGNGRMGQRANFEETFTGETLQGNYVAGVYYPDKTRVGWWKNGYPEYFAKVLNAADWAGIHIKVDGEVLDLNTAAEVRDFRRILNMKEGYLQRTCVVTLKDGKELRIDAQRFCSIVDDEAGALRYSLRPLNFSGKITFTVYVDADVKNADANYDEKFWEPVSEEAGEREAYVVAKTKKTAFQVATAMHFAITEDAKVFPITIDQVKAEKYAANNFDINAKEDSEYVIYKYGVNLSSILHPEDELLSRCKEYIQRIAEKGYDRMLEEQALAWKQKWEHMDVVIEGDISAQQGIRFNIFQLCQTYTGKDNQLNIGPKGFTGEKYGGSTYWDTEAYCLPFYLSTSGDEVARNLLIYRYRHLGKAIENAQKLGFKNGAALYPMVTMNGEESHNEWEITFEEIHRNGAIAYAIYNYCNCTGDWQYLEDYGLEVLIAIARFWTQRVNLSVEKNQYVILGVTGPNEYENNVNNNWYTNKIACWCLEFAADAILHVKNKAPEKYAQLEQKLNFQEYVETAKWKDICDKMFFPDNEQLDIFLQQEGYMDKEQLLVKDLPAAERPLNQHWSWDRILRSCFIKQADVLQGLYFFEHQYDEETIRRNYDFYEPRTVHESSLSPCVHSILAAKLGKEEKAYELYLRTARLDLDDYNNDTEDGCHITSMAGTWMSIVQGFAGMRVRKDTLHFAPFIPEQWTRYSFNILYRGHPVTLDVRQDVVIIDNHSEKALEINIFEEAYTIQANKPLSVKLNT